MDEPAATDIAVKGKYSTVLRFSRRIRASPERVFQAWTRPEALRHWWCPEGWLPAEVEIDLRIGGVYQIRMRRKGGSCSEQVGVIGQFRQIEPGTKLVYTWRWEGAFPDMPETEVTVIFRAIDDGTEVALFQRDLALPLCTQHLGGWLDAMGRLEQLLERV